MIVSPTATSAGHAADLAHFAATPIGEESSGRTPMYGAYLEKVPALCECQQLCFVLFPITAVASSHSMQQRLQRDHHRSSDLETTWNHGGEDDYTESLRRLLQHMCMTTPPPPPPSPGGGTSSTGTQQQLLAPRLFVESVAVGSGHVQGGPYNAPTDGLYKPAVPIWTTVAPGALLRQRVGQRQGRLRETERARSFARQRERDR